MPSLPSTLAARYRFPDPGRDQVVELRAFTHGLQPESVPSMMEAFVEDWRLYGVDAWNQVPNHWRPEAEEPVGWWSLPTYLADEFVAPLLSAPPGTCILQPHVHWSLQCVLSAPEVAARGSSVVVTEGEFPSVLHSVKQWSHLVDVSPRVVPSRDDGTPDVEAVADAIGPDTAMVALSHVGFTTGARLPDPAIQSLSNAAHRHDALFLLDGYHSASTMPVDVASLGVDLFTGGLLKEASGSSGNTFIYIRDGLDLTPRTTGWFGDADPFGFQPDPEPHPEVRRRFLGGTTSVASMYHAVEGLRILLDAGLGAVQAHSLTLTDRAIDHADRLGISLRSPRDRDRRSAMVVLEIDHARALSEHLKTRQIYTDSRQDEVIRMAPFTWNDLDDVDRAFEEIENVLQNRHHLDHTAPSTGPVT